MHVAIVDHEAVVRKVRATNAMIVIESRLDELLLNDTLAPQMRVGISQIS
jgi:hypothetical protein